MIDLHAVWCWYVR